MFKILVFVGLKPPLRGLALASQRPGGGCPKVASEKLGLGLSEVGPLLLRGWGLGLAGVTAQTKPSTGPKGSAEDTRTRPQGKNNSQPTKSHNTDRCVLTKACQKTHFFKKSTGRLSEAIAPSRWLPRPRLSKTLRLHQTLCLDQILASAMA